MRRPAVFFDRDNTLIVGHDYIGDPNRVELIPGAPTAIAKCRQMGFAVVVVSNQSGVARGMFTEVDVRACNRRLDALLLASNGGAVIDRHEYCPFHPDAKISAYKQDSFLRKPKPGMILAAADAMALDLANSWVVGDAPRDIAAGKAAGCRAILIVDKSLTPSPAAFEDSAAKPDFTVTTLPEAIEIISQQLNKPAPASHQSPPPAAEIPPEPEQPLKPAPERSRMTIASQVLDSELPPQGDVRSLAERGPKPSSIPVPAVAPPSPADAPTSQVRFETSADRHQVEPAQFNLSRLELVNQQVLMELKKFNEHHHDDFSLSKLVAGITQILAIAAVPLSYVMYRGDMPTMQAWLLTAIFLQMLTIAMLIMGRQR